MAFNQMLAKALSVPTDFRRVLWNGARHRTFPKASSTIYMRVLWRNLFSQTHSKRTTSRTDMGKLLWTTSPDMEWCILYSHEDKFRSRSYNFVLIVLHRAFSSETTLLRTKARRWVEHAARCCVKAVSVLPMINDRILLKDSLAPYAAWLLLPWCTAERQCFFGDTLFSRRCLFITSLQDGTALRSYGLLRTKSSMVNRFQIPPLWFPLGVQH